MGEVTACPVAIFVNRTDGVPQALTFLMAEAQDCFLLPYLKAVLQGGSQPIQLFIYKEYVSWITELQEEFPDNIRIEAYGGQEEIHFSKDRLLVVSYRICAQLLDDKFQRDPIPSLLIIRPEIDRKT